MDRTDEYWFGPTLQLLKGTIQELEQEGNIVFYRSSGKGYELQKIEDYFIDGKCKKNVLTYFPIKDPNRLAMCRMLCMLYDK